MMRVRPQRSVVDLVTLAVGVMLFVLMLAGCFSLLQSGKAASRAVLSETTHVLDGDHGTPTAASAVSATRSTEIEIPLLGRRVTSEALAMGCILFAGLVGGYLRYMRERLDELTASEPEPKQSNRPSDPPVQSGIDPMLTFVSRLLMGLGAASVFGLFIPLAIAEPPGLSTFNPWGLLILGGASGYLSRNVFGGLQAKFERLLAEVQRSGQIDPSSAEFSSAVKQGVLDALGTPMPTNFEGTLGIEVTESSGENCVRYGESGAYAELRRGGTYTLRAVFKPGLQREGSASSHIQHIQITGGVEALQVPFELRLELGFLPDFAPLERSATIDKQSDNSVTFEVAVPLKIDERVSMETKPEVALFVYQGNLFCAVATLPVQWVN